MLQKVPVCEGDAFGQTGTVQDLYPHHRIDTAAIVAAANAASAGRPIRYLRAIN